jgi:molybdate transport system substrate-binding protein
MQEQTMYGLSKVAAAVMAACLGASIGASCGRAAEIKILSSRNVQPEMDAIIPAFERSSGHKVSISYVATAEFIDHFKKGLRVDMAILFTETMDRFLATTKISVSSRFDILQSGIGAVVRARAPKPDISSIAALKSTLLRAKSVAFSQGPTGVYMATVVQQLGIAEQLKPKMILTDSGIGAVGNAVADGKAEVGIHGTYELLSVPGIDFVGPIPRDLQKCMVYSAVIPAEAHEGETAKTLARFLSSEIAIPLIQQQGMEPIAVH